MNEIPKDLGEGIIDTCAVDIRIDTPKTDWVIQRFETSGYVNVVDLIEMLKEIRELIGGVRQPEATARKEMR